MQSGPPYTPFLMHGDQFAGLNINGHMQYYKTQTGKYMYESLLINDEQRKLPFTEEHLFRGIFSL